MRRSGMIPLCAFALCWGGCASSSAPNPTPEPVDTWAMYPDLGARTNITPPLAAPMDQMGQLVIYAPQSGDIRSSYSIFDKDGRFKTHVDNRNADSSPGPTKEGLAPGRYLIRLDDPSQGPPKFWVNIEKGKLTAVHEEELASRKASPS